MSSALLQHASHCARRVASSAASRYKIMYRQVPVGYTCEECMWNVVQWAGMVASSSTAAAPAPAHGTLTSIVSKNFSAGSFRVCISSSAEYRWSNQLSAAVGGSALPPDATS